MAYVTNRLQKDERWQRHLLGDWSNGDLRSFGLLVPEATQRGWGDACSVRIFIGHHALAGSSVVHRTDEISRLDLDLIRGNSSRLWERYIDISILFDRYPSSVSMPIVSEMAWATQWPCWPGTPIGVRHYDGVRCANRSPLIGQQNLQPFPVISLAANTCPDSKVRGANMGPIWGRQDPGGPHVGPMNLTIRVDYGD